MHAKDPTKLRVRDLQPTVRSTLVYLPIPSHEVSLTVFVPEYGAEGSTFQVTHAPCYPALPYIEHVMLRKRKNQFGSCCEE